MKPKDYNTETRRLGYEIQVISGIVNPNESTKTDMVNLKNKLKRCMDNFKSEYPNEYADSIPINHYKKMLNKNLTYA